MITFTPASSANCAGAFGACNKNTTFVPSNHDIIQRFNSFTLNWWQQNSFFQYPAMLCSAFYGIKDCWNYREHYNIPKDVLLVADSGGFEQLTQNTRIEALDVLKWQENNADVGFVLDVPPLNPVTLGPLDDFSLFTKCAETTKRNAEIALRNRTNDKMKLYYVIQGSNRKELSHWIDRVDLTVFDGVALSFKPPNDPLQIALLSSFTNEKQIANIHILLGTGHNVVPIIIYVSKYFRSLTFDSSSYGKGARTMTYDLPFRLQTQFGRAYNNKLKILPCNCPVCSNLTINDFQRGDSVSGALISLHNLYLYIQHVEFLKAIVEDEELFLNYIKKACSPKTLEAYEYLKLYEEKGFDVAYKKYFAKSNLGEWFG